MPNENDTRLLPLSVLAARLNRDTPYRCVCRNGGAEIFVGDTRLWFDERAAREVLTAVLFVEDEVPDLLPRGGFRFVAMRHRAVRQRIGSVAPVPAGPDSPSGASIPRVRENDGRRSFGACES